MKITIVYDGECPICRRLVTATRLRERGAELEQVDARTGSLDDIQGTDLRELDFDEGFAVVVDGKVHHGAEGARVLALLSEPTGLFFRLFQYLVNTERRSRICYPVFRACRNLLLRLLRIPRIGKPHKRT
jgi:predicted DCC family thiol-disulfide oxidoreductase YuxK